MPGGFPHWPLARLSLVSQSVSVLRRDRADGAVYAGATLLALQMAYSPPPAVKTDGIEKLNEME